MSELCDKKKCVMMIRYIASDCDAVSIIHDAQGYAKTPEDAVAAVLKAGIRPSPVFFLFVSSNEHELVFLFNKSSRCFLFILKID